MIKSAKDCRSILQILILKEKNPELREAYSQSKMAWIKKIERLERSFSVAKSWERLK
jgi:hypothetical protein